jgi:hypothetical protein
LGNALVYGSIWIIEGNPFWLVDSLEQSVAQSLVCFFFS